MCARTTILLVFQDNSPNSAPQDKHPPRWSFRGDLHGILQRGHSLGSFTKFLQGLLQGGPCSFWGSFKRGGGGPSHNTTQHNTTQHNTTQHDAKHNTTQHNTTQHNTAQHNTTQHNTTQHSTTQHNTAQHNTTQHNTPHHTTTQHNTPHHTTQHLPVSPPPVLTFFLACKNTSLVPFPTSLPPFRLPFLPR